MQTINYDITDDLTEKWWFENAKCGTFWDQLKEISLVTVPVLSSDLREEQQSLSLILPPALEALITAVSSGV